MAHLQSLNFLKDKNGNYRIVAIHLLIHSYNQ